MTNDFAIGLHIVGFLTASEGASLTSEVIAKTYGTSPVVVRRVLGKLQTAGIVASKRGVGGGSVLAASPEEVTLRHVFEAVSETSQILVRPPSDEGEVSRVLGEFIGELFDEAEQALLTRLESLNVSQMDEEVRPKIIAALRAKKRLSN